MTSQITNKALLYNEELINSYTPIIINSHAGYPSIQNNCNSIQDKKSPYNSIFQIPENMIIVDFIPHTTCPYANIYNDTELENVIVTQYNHNFITGEFIKNLIEYNKQIEYYNINLFNLYRNNTKIYFPGDYYTNLNITFDDSTNDNLWDIKMIDKQRFVNIFDKEIVNKYKNDKCINLKDLISFFNKKLKYPNTKKSSKFNPLNNKQQIIIYLNSCRSVVGEINKQIMNNIIEIENQGLINTDLYRQHTLPKNKFINTTERILRSVLKNEFIDKKSYNKYYQIEQLYRLDTAKLTKKLTKKKSNKQTIKRK